MNPSFLRRTAALLICLLALPSDPSFGQSRWTGIDSSRVAWLSSNVITLDNDRGIRAWADHVSQSNVVALGEATHGDGSAFLLRSRLTLALHERSGFGQLALEALGAFDPADSLRSGSAFLWSGSNEAWPGLNAALESDPIGGLTVRGMDVQHRYHLPWWDRTEMALRKTGMLDSSWVDIRGRLEAAFSNPFVPVPARAQQRIRHGVASFGDVLRQHGSPELARFLDNALANAATAWEQNYSPRNRQMATNILSLATDGSKVTVWAASSHLVRSLQAIDTMTDEWSYDGAGTVGEALAITLDDGYRVIAFSACGGSYGAEHIRLSESSIDEPLPGSLEALICALPFETAAYLDLRQARTDLQSGWLQVPLLAGPLGYRPKRASWPLAIDGIIVMRTMAPSTPRNTD